jgi:Flp pilus assembly protein TadG
VKKVITVRRNRGLHATAEPTRSLLVAGGSRRRSLLRETGQSVVEFALVLPLFCALVFALIDFGKAVYYYIQLTHVANEGARIVAVNPATLPGGSSSLKSYLCNQLGSSSSELRTGSYAVSRANVAISYPQGTQNIGDPVKVQVSTVYHWIPYFGAGTMSIGASAVMRLEQSTSGNTLLSGGQCS